MNVLILLVALSIFWNSMPYVTRSANVAPRADRVCPFALAYGPMLICTCRQRKGGMMRIVPPAFLARPFPRSPASTVRLLRCVLSCHSNVKLRSSFTNNKDGDARRVVVLPGTYRVPEVINLGLLTSIEGWSSYPNCSIYDGLVPDGLPTLFQNVSRAPLSRHSLFSSP